MNGVQTCALPISKRLREAIEQEAKADAQSGEAKGAIIDIAV